MLLETTGIWNTGIWETYIILSKHFCNTTNKDKRIVIKNGGIVKIIETSKEEKENLLYLQSMDEKIGNIRNFLRSGKEINFNIKKFFYK